MEQEDEELSGVSGDETKKLPKPKQNDWDSDSDGDSTDELPYVINEIIAKHGLPFVKTSVVSDVCRFIESKIDTDKLEEAFYVIDLRPVFRRWLTWMQLMPRVKPHYAVKCNPNPAILGLLAALGAGFDCASAKELDIVSSLGVDVSKRVIFANPCKLPGHIRHAFSVGCYLTTFDTESELWKIKQLYPTMELVLRIRADDPNARCQLGNKFGTEMADVPGLLNKAHEMGLKVVGISFHVGSGATDPAAFTAAIRSARIAWDTAAALGFPLRVLDIGGGFCGEHDVDGRALAPVAEAVNAALAEHFPTSMEIQVIAEPGRYFAEACATLATNVYGHRRRVVADGDSGETKVAMDYWISDGLYGSMNCLVYDHATLAPKTLHITSKPNNCMYPSTLFGPTCDGLDVVARDIPMPLLETGDWVVFPCMGAYTMAAGSDFNGFNITQMKRYYVWSLDGVVDVDVGPPGP